MSAEQASMGGDLGAASGGGAAFRTIVYIAQTLFGAWYLIHGLNHWIPFFPQPSGSESATYLLISALMKTGLFTFIKASEVLAGLMLLTHRFVPLGVVIAIPSAVVIAWLNVFLHPDIGSKIVGGLAVGILALIAVAHFDAFRGLLRADSGPPQTRAFREWLRTRGWRDSAQG